MKMLRTSEIQSLIDKVREEDDANPECLMFKSHGEKTTAVAGT